MRISKEVEGNGSGVEGGNENELKRLKKEE